MSEKRHIDTSLELRSEVNKPKYVVHRRKLEVWDDNGNEYWITDVVDDQDGDNPIMRIEIQKVDASIPQPEEFPEEPPFNANTEQPEKSHTDD